MGIDIQTLNRNDDDTIDAVLRLRTAAHAVDEPAFPPPGRRDFFGAVRHEVPWRRNEYRVALLDGEIVGFLDVNLPLSDNTENAELGIVVHPEYRRRGVGRALYEHAVRLLRDLGRKRIAGFTPETPIQGAPSGEVPGTAFAYAMGAKVALTEVRRRLDVSTVDLTAHDALLADAWQKADGYRLVQWRNRVPDEYTADVAYLDSRLVTDAPMGDLAWEPERIDTARLRKGEEAREIRGIRDHSTGLVHEASGRLVALTAIGLESDASWHAYQWITIVDPSHRGHRLGTIAKIENLRYALAQDPEIRVIDTWNAAVNDHMISINEAIGCRAAERWLNWQQEV